MQTGTAMTDDNEQIRQRAYKIWMDEGCPEGRAEIHWEMAQKLVADENKGAAEATPATKYEQR
jgi:hypothetical protein